MPELWDSFAAAQQPAAAPDMWRQPEMRSYEPSYGEQLKGGLSDIFKWLGADQYTANKFGDIVRTGAEIFPPTGIPLAVNEMQRGVEAREPLDVGLAALGAVPGVKPAISMAKTGPLWSAISDVKLRKPLSEMEHRYKDVRDPVQKIFEPEQMVGGNLILTPSDLSAGNRTLTHVDDVKLDRPVRAQGGVSFPEANPGMAWASEGPIATRLDNQAARLAETGKPVYIAPMTMSPSGIDASHHVADPLSQLVQQAPIKRDDATAFNTMMKEMVPDWVSIRSPKFQDYINDLKGGMRIKAAMADRMGLAEWQKKGFPDVAAIRHAMSEPGLIEAPRNTTGMTISQYIPGQGVSDTSHRSYSKGVAGEFKGQWPELVPFDIAAPDIAKGLAAKNAENLAAGKKVKIEPAYHMGRPSEGIPTHQVLDQEWLDNIMRFFEMKNR